MNTALDIAIKENANGSTLGNGTTTEATRKNVAMHPILSPFVSAFQKRFETLQYQFEKTSSQHWQ